MPATIEKRNIVGMQAVAASLASDLASNGFSVLGCNQTSTSTIDIANFEDCLLAATDSVDPIAVEADDSGSSVDQAIRQPWRLMIEASDASGDIRITANTPTNIITEQGGAYRAAVFGNAVGQGVRISGLLAKGCWDKGAHADIQYFDTATRKNPTRASTFNVASWGVDLNTLDYEAIPFSYRLTVSKHGIAFCMWIESRDNQGDAFGWFLIQRMVDKSGAPVVKADSSDPNAKEAKAPLYCVFSPSGGGGVRRSGDPLNTPEAWGIMQFVVREVDTNAPTVPRSATIDSADSARIINSIQQIATTENDSYILKTMSGLCTQRNTYPHELDLITYTSADVVPQWNEPTSTLFGEQSARRYKAMNANHPQNKGMRILMLIEGAPLS